jgi:hypothetical protein
MSFGVGNLNVVTGVAIGTWNQFEVPTFAWNVAPPL